MQSALGLRVLSAAVLAPVAIGAVLLGGWAFAILVLIAALILATEWRGLLGPGGVLPLPATVAGVWAAAAFAPPGIALAVLAVAAVVQALCERPVGRPAWAALGVLYVGLPVVALLWLREGPANGWIVVLWLMAVVWATDIGAYAAGRTFGGRKLAPTWSPNKTRAGALGGIAAAAAAAGLFWIAGWNRPLLGAMVAAAALSVVAQAGDLAESIVKRRFHVKDMGNLIPGHGGLFDRLDSMLAAAPILALAIAATGGEAGLWQATSGE